MITLRQIINRWLVAALMRIKYLEMMLFILVSGATPSISVSSVVPNRALSRSTLLCNLSISTSYWKRRDVALLVTRHTRYKGVPLGDRSERKRQRRKVTIFRTVKEELVIHKVYVTTSIYTHTDELRWIKREL